jgi:phage gp29-like protein
MRSIDRIRKPPRKRKTVALRTNGKHKIKGATVNAPMTMNRLLRPQARYNWLMPNVGAITPAYIEMVLNGALAGSHVAQYELFDLMLRTWPELSACCQELTYGVMRKKLIFEPFCDEDEKPTPGAIERQKIVSTALKEMQPDAENDGNDLDGTLKNILDGWLRGVSVSEIVWETIDAAKLGTIAAPRTTFWVQPTQYAFAWDNSIGLRPRKERSGGGVYPFSTTSSQPVIVDPFPPNKFLVAIHKAKTGSPLGGPLLVPLAWWWCAANFSSDWLLNLAQVFGLPFRWANYDANAPQATIDAICTMLQNMGSAGWAAFPVGTTLEMINTGSQNGSDHSPQGELLDRADRYARNLILGQTMTGSHGTTGKGGGQAFGKVEEHVKDDRIDAAGRFAESIINKQLIPYILLLNYGDTKEAPSIKFLEDEVADLTEAQRDKVLVDAGLPIGVDYMRKKYDIPEPAEGEETLTKPEPTGFGGGFGGPQDSENPEETNAPNEEQDAAKAGDITLRSPSELKISVVDNHIIRGYMARIESGEELAPVVLRESGRIKDGNHRAAAYKKLGMQVPTVMMSGDKPGHAFHGNQFVNIGEAVNTPFGRGIVVAQDYHNVWVSTTKGIKVVKRTDVVKVPQDKSKFPSITHSAENERRAALNTKLEEINEIEDDALFAKELKQLAGELK